MLAKSGAMLRAGEENKIHPGADDNGSGTAWMMELAASLAKESSEDPEKFRRGVIFANPGGPGGEGTVQIPAWIGFWPRALLRGRSRSFGTPGRPLRTRWNPSSSRIGVASRVPRVRQT